MRTVTATALVMLLGTLSNACEEDRNCVAGHTCVCENESCQETCGGSGAGCAFNCIDGASCEFDCSGGSCATTANSADSVHLDCPGGSCGLDAAGTREVVLNCTGNNCSLNCQGADVCRLTGCTTGCSVDCGGAAVCESSCDFMEGCSVAN